MVSMGNGEDCSWCRWAVVKIVRCIDGSGEDCSCYRWVVVEIVRRVDG